MLAVVDDARVVAGDGHAAWSESFNEMFMQVAGSFSNARVRRHGRAYVLGLLSQAERKNSWQLAEFAGDASPDGMQRLLNFSPWDEDAARDAAGPLCRAGDGRPGGGAGGRRDGVPEEGPHVGRRGPHVHGHRGQDRELPGRRVRGLCHPGRRAGADRPGAVPAGEVDGRPGPVPGRRDRRRRRVRDQAGAGPDDDRAAPGTPGSRSPGSPATRSTAATRGSARGWKSTASPTSWPWPAATSSRWRPAGCGRTRRPPWSRRTGGSG